MFKKFHTQKFINIIKCDYSILDTKKQLFIQLREDLKKSMLSKDTIRSNVIKSILSDLQYLKTNGKEITEDQIYNCIFKGIQSRKDSIKLFEQGQCHVFYPSFSCNYGSESRNSSFIRTANGVHEGQSGRFNFLFADFSY